MLANGDTYYPRTVGGTTDVKLLRTLRSLKLGIGLKGEPGAGKTTLPEAAFGADSLV